MYIIYWFWKKLYRKIIRKITLEAIKNRIKLRKPNIAGMKFEKVYEKGVDIIIYEIPIELSNKFVRLSQAHGFKK